MNKIKNKLLVVLFLVALLPVLLIGGYALYASMDSLRASSIAIHKSRVTLITERIENYLNVVSSDLFYLRDSNALHLYFSVLKSNNSHSERLLLTNLRSSLSKFSEQKEIYQQVRFIDRKGTEVVRIDRDNGKSKNISDTNLQDKSSSEYFKQTINRNNNILYISAIDLNRENGKIEEALRPVIHFASPVYDKQETLQGIIVLNVMLDKVFGFIQEQETEGEQLTFTDPEGYYYYHTDTRKRWGSQKDLATNINLFSDYPNLKEPLAVTEQLATLELDEDIMTYQSVILNGGRINLGNLISIAPEAVVYKPVRNFISVFLGVALLTLLLSFFLALFLSSLISKPLMQLTERIEQLSAGDIETPIRMTSNDEIGKLAHAVELLRKSLKILMKRAS
ncbi:MAG: HAMP domain-containing protein [Methylococcales bacterium]